VPCLGREELAQIATDADRRIVTERLRGGRIDREKRPLEIVRADQPEAVLDEVTIPALALMERRFDCGYPAPGFFRTFD
jgi:hypothetical protein